MKNAVILTILLCFSCNEKTVLEKQESKYTALKKANWFLGGWEHNSTEGKLSENWRKLNDSTFFGESYYVIQNDTVFSEIIQL